VYKRGVSGSCKVSSLASQNKELSKHFSRVTDPPDERKISHLLTDIIGLAVIATIIGCEGYDDVDDFIIEKKNCCTNACNYATESRHTIP
jgi:hypothetical protein